MSDRTKYRKLEEEAQRLLVENLNLKLENESLRAENEELAKHLMEATKPPRSTFVSASGLQMKFPLT